MRSAVGGLLIALVLFAVAAVLWSEAGAARRIADAHLRFATLKYDHDDGIDEGASVLNRVHLPIRSVTAELPEHRAKLAYWRSDYANLTALAPVIGSNKDDSSAEPALMLVAANAAFRTTMRDPGDKATTVERLDRVIQAYGDVLRAQPDNTDASYNYEYVARFRDTYAKARNPKIVKEAPRRVDGELDASVDLPIGPTVHGRPGGPPQDLPMQQFRTVTPMRFEEREELEPGRGPRPRRRG
jgi:hypothetical protein